MILNRLSYRRFMPATPNCGKPVRQPRRISIKLSMVTGVIPMPTFITSVPGIGGVTAAVLSKHGFKTAEDLADASPEALAAVPGFGEQRAAVVIEDARSVLEADKSETSGEAFQATFSDLRFTEVTIDGVTYQSTPVADGETFCIDSLVATGMTM